MLTYNLTNSQFNQANTVSRILVIDRSPLVPFAIKKLLAKNPYMNVVGQCRDRYNVIPLLKKCNPSLIIIDPDLPHPDGIGIIKQLQRHSPTLKFIIFTQENRNTNIDELIKLNIHGVVLKDSDISNLLSSIHTVCRGFTFMDKALTPYSTNEEKRFDIRTLSDSLTLPRISPREKQILCLISQGLKNKEIAEKLSISIKTVESHRLNLMKKLDAHSIVDLMKWAIRLNIT